MNKNRLVMQKVEETKKKCDVIRGEMEDVHLRAPPSCFSDQCMMERQGYFPHRSRGSRRHHSNYRVRCFKNTRRREINSNQDHLSDKEESKVNLNLEMTEKKKKEYELLKTARIQTGQELVNQSKTTSRYCRRDLETSSHGFTKAERTSSKSDSQEKGKNWRSWRSERSWHGGPVVTNRKGQRGMERGRPPSWGPRRGGRRFLRQRGCYSSFGNFMLDTDPDIEDESDVAPTRNRSVRLNQDMTITVKVKNEMSTTGVNVSRVIPPTISSKSSQQRMLTTTGHQNKPPKKPVIYVSKRQKSGSSLPNESKESERDKCSIETELSDTFKTKINLTENQDCKISSSSATVQTTIGKNTAVTSNDSCVEAKNNSSVSPHQNATDFKEDVLSCTAIKSELEEIDKAPVEDENCKTKMSINSSTTESEGDDSWEDMTSGPESLELSGISFNKAEVINHRSKSREDQSCCTKDGLEESVNTIENL
ncbi:uncharacterized protein LOC106469842 isoform X2 [Limulus polyphemus]|uniref:Uncharacterized protein LOC106469842 isoform X2 n=1 Tax=Limulus polyphemus TaxID=6850 RepID=A0ABM1TGA6_LIMPO|nr:uncharacterized protein LOC106469842 isoform X2 [Limulus polyphemus]XP_022254912.1 uncharacterized protein LOC106469842 isoform X2 [Limulus polyphemus]